MSKKFDVTVFIPTWFAEPYAVELFDAVLNQEVPFKYEVLVYDSSSSDRTQEILAKYEKKYDNFRYKVIAQKDFGHGKTRQAAARDAHGATIVYLSQDATPANKYWLHEMVKPFDLNKDVVAVLGKQEARAHAFPLLKSEIRAVFNGLGPDLGTTLFYRDKVTINQDSVGFLGFYSDVNSATKKDFLLSVIPYRDVPYAEDQLFGKDIIEAGYVKAYAPRGKVIHSNDMKLSEYKNRMFDETLGLRRVGFDLTPPSTKNIMKAVFTGIIKDWFATIKDPQYSLKQKLYWMVFNPLFHIEKWRGVRLATTVNLTDKDMISQNSLEARRTREKE